MADLTHHRYIADDCRRDLDEKLVFIGGPRQVGKTTLALHMLGSKSGAGHPAYLNWDIATHRQRILNGELPVEPLVVLDEIHKFARWRSLLKGFYDEHFPVRSALVTGSARLDYYRKGGDSLQGRYHYYRLHPYSLTELSNQPTPDDLQTLLRFGGFPEPLARQNTTHWRRWQRERQARVFADDLTSLERVNEVSMLELLFAALPSRVGSPLSLQALRRELQVSHDSIRRWLTIFDNLYLTFRLSPFGSPRVRAVKKEQKLYLWDWSVLEEIGPRFEKSGGGATAEILPLQGRHQGIRYGTAIPARHGPARGGLCGSARPSALVRRRVQSRRKGAFASPTLLSGPNGYPRVLPSAPGKRGLPVPQGYSGAALCNVCQRTQAAVKRR